MSDAAFLSDLGHITRAKLLLAVALATVGSLFPRVVCSGCGTPDCCLTLNLSQLQNHIQAKGEQVSAAQRFLGHASLPLERNLDLGNGFLAVLLVSFLATGCKKSERLTLRQTTTVAALGTAVAVYLAQQGVLRWCAGTGALEPALVATAIKDAVDLLLFAWLALFLWHPTATSGTPQRFAVTLGALSAFLLLVQITGLVFRYDGLVPSPNPSFALLLGAAYVVAPTQLLLVLVTTWHFVPRGAGRLQI